MDRRHGPSDADVAAYVREYCADSAAMARALAMPRVEPRTSGPVVGPRRLSHGGADGAAALQMMDGLRGRAGTAASEGRPRWDASPKATPAEDPLVVLLRKEVAAHHARTQRGRDSLRDPM